MSAENDPAQAAQPTQPTQSYHDGLEVVPHSEHTDYQKYPTESTDKEKFPYYSPVPVTATPHGDDTNKIAYGATANEQYPPKTICGLRKRTFWILVAVAVVIVAAAVGGGVGGALASNKKSSDNSNSSSNPAESGSPSSAPSSAPSSGSSTRPTPTTSQVSVTTTEVVGPTNTLLRDCPSSNDTIYSANFGADKTMQFRKMCGNSFVNANGFDSSVILNTKSLDDCINSCVAYNIQNQTQIANGQSRICNSVCWRNTFDKANDQVGGACFGFTTQNMTVSGQTAFRIRSPAEFICDSAALINQP